MAEVTAKVTVNSGAVQGLVHGPDVKRSLRKVAEDVRTQAVRNCPVDTGDLRSSLAVHPEGDGYVIGSRLAYALYVHEGHGTILPRRASILRWPNVNNRYKQTGGNRRYSGGATAEYIYARRVRPVKGRPFLRDALQQVVTRTGGRML